MAFASHHAEVMFRVLVAVLHLDRVARQLRLTAASEVALILLPRVDPVRYPAYRLLLPRHPSHSGVHCAPFFMRAMYAPTTPNHQGSWSVAVNVRRWAPALSGMTGPAPRMTRVVYMGWESPRLKRAHVPIA